MSAGILSKGGATEREQTNSDLAPAAPSQPRAHVPALDGVRGLAILMVLVFHFVGEMVPTSRVEKALAWVIKNGALGVELFFVLSGFLITGILYEARNKRHYFRNFYMRRLLRIFPLYYGVLAAVFFVAPLFPIFRGPDLTFLREHQAWAWLYGVNVYIAMTGSWSFRFLEHFWSLCVEEHFYFVWPAVVWALARDARRLMWVSLTLALGAMVARTVANEAGLNWWTTYVLTPFRLDGLALGAFLAMAAREPGGLPRISRLIPRVAWMAAATAVGTYAWVLVTSAILPIVYTLRVCAFEVLLATLLMRALVAPTETILSRFFRSRFMRFLGTYSYGLYVYHHFFSYYLITHRTEFVVARWVGSHLLAVLLQALVAGAASVAVAYVSYELVEKRILALKRYF